MIQHTDMRRCPWCSGQKKFPSGDDGPSCLGTGEVHNICGMANADCECPADDDKLSPRKKVIPYEKRRGESEGF
jgi:hypothetical protein